MITKRNQLIKKLEAQGKGDSEFAIIENPSYIHPEFEIAPLAAPLEQPNGLKALLMDMDGTTTTTETLCIYSLELMLRRMSGLMTNEAWPGLKPNEDYPNIIGNSTTNHVEYLVKTYGHLLKPNAVLTEFLKAAQWTLDNSHDENRKKEVAQNVKIWNLEGLLGSIRPNQMADEIAIKQQDLGRDQKVSMGIDIYYQIYHKILSGITKETLGSLNFEGGLSADEELITPMPGIAFMLPFVKGWLGDEVEQAASLIIAPYERRRGKKLNESEKSNVLEKLALISKRFEKHPVKLGLVTSSIFYEADIVIKQVLRVVQNQISETGLSDKRKSFITDQLNDYHAIYDTFVTATDSSEIRLKPHRDLYSMALRNLGINPHDFDKVIGFEDSQSGTVAIRAAGIGCCVAVPFQETSAHDLAAAVHVLAGGIPEAIINHHLFLTP